MIFILLGAITALLDAGSRVRSWLIALPFVGVFIYILAFWLKAFVSPAFFWLHIPGLCPDLRLCLAEGLQMGTGIVRWVFTGPVTLALPSERFRNQSTDI
jgi:hypothetical protein